MKGRTSGRCTHTFSWYLYNTDGHFQTHRGVHGSDSCNIHKETPAALSPQRVVSHNDPELKTRAQLITPESPYTIFLLAQNMSSGGITKHNTNSSPPLSAIARWQGQAGRVPCGPHCDLSPPNMRFQNIGWSQRVLGTSPYRGKTIKTCFLFKWLPMTRDHKNPKINPNF